MSNELYGFTYQAGGNGRDRFQGKRALILIWMSDYEHTIYDT
jgi:hypothetical protein